MKTLAIVQARLGSKRFPKKVLSEIKGKSIIEILLSRLSQSKEIDKIVVATTSKKEDLELVSLVSRLGYEYFCGSENDVLDRFYRASKKQGVYLQGSLCSA